MHYYQHHIGDFIRDAGNLPNDCLGAYMRMLWKYYVDETPLAGEVEDIAFDAATTQEIARQLLRRYFYPTPEGWRHRRCDEEIEKYREKSEKARASANARHREANAQRTQCERNANAPKNDANHKPITINQEKKDQKKGRAPLALPDWLPESVWAMWHDFRNARKGWTPKARELSLSSLTRLRDQGHEPRAVIEQSIERGWTGLFPIQIHGNASARAGPNRDAARVVHIGRQAQALVALEAMKNGGVDQNSGGFGAATAGLLGFGPDPGGGAFAVDGNGVGRVIDA